LKKDHISKGQNKVSTLYKALELSGHK
jgi:hypothetical protein